MNRPIPSISFDGCRTWPRINAHTSPEGITLSTVVNGQPITQTFPSLDKQGWEGFIEQAQAAAPAPPALFYPTCSK